MSPRYAGANGGPIAEGTAGFSLPDVNRRSLLLGGAAALAGLVVTGTQLSLPSLPFLDAAPRVGELTAATFTPHVGSTFAIRTAAEGVVSLVLTEVVRVRRHPSEPAVISGEAFSLLFEGPKGTIIEAAEHQLIHQVLTVPSLFVHPYGRSSTTQEYQVIVDHRLFDFEQKDY